MRERDRDRQSDSETETRYRETETERQRETERLRGHGMYGSFTRTLTDTDQKDNELNSSEYITRQRMRRTKKIEDILPKLL